jgi:cardiolipin synthase A/B
MKNRLLNGALMTGLVLSPLANAQESSQSGAVYKYTQDILGLRQVTQKTIEAANEEYDMLFRTLSDVEQHVKFRLIDPKTQDEKDQKYVLSSMVKSMNDLNAQEVDYKTELNKSLSPLAVSNGRLLGVGVPPVFSLYNGYSISKKSDDVLKPTVENFGTSVREACFTEKRAPVGAKEKFLNLDIGSLSCIQVPEEARLITEPLDAISAKIELLTGKPLTQEIVDKADPKHQLDMSKAPQLDSIFLSYLEYKNDFSGQMVGQALKFHAARGTQVRIILPGLWTPESSSFVSKKDKALLAELKAFSPNIQIDMYKFGQSNPDITTPLQIIGRSYHAKMLVVLSKTDARYNAVIVGGRNIKDTFYMKKLPDYSKYPEMTQYGPTGEKFAFYRDLEVLVRGRATAETLASQFMSFWRRDKTGPRVLKTSEHIAALTLSDENRSQLKDKIGAQSHIRHFYAVPYTDDRAVEQVYVNIISSAQKKIRIVNPYVRPTKAVASAIRDALLRGVNIDFISGFDFALDNTAGFVGDMNKMSVSSLLKKSAGAPGKIRFFSWNEQGPFSIVHSKAIAVDNDVLYVGSANMDLRTFVHDIENGMVITGPVVADFIKLYDSFYISNAKEITEKLQTKRFMRILISILDALHMT